MTDIKPEMTDGNALCQESCPRHTVANGKTLSACAMTAELGGYCSPWYRTEVVRVQELFAEKMREHVAWMNKYPTRSQLIARAEKAESELKLLKSGQSAAIGLAQEYQLALKMRAECRTEFEHMLDWLKENGPVECASDEPPRRGFKVASHNHEGGSDCFVATHDQSQRETGVEVNDAKYQKAYRAHDRLRNSEERVGEILARTHEWYGEFLLRVNSSPTDEAQAKAEHRGWVGKKENS